VNPSAFRFSRHHLGRRAPAGTAVDVARRLCGLHAQVMSSADLSLWARVRGLGADDLSRALWDERTLVKTWLMRGTLHAVPADDLPLFVSALDNRGRYDAAWPRNYALEAASMERLIEAIYDVLDGARLTRAELVQAVRPRVGRQFAERLRSGWGEFLKPASRRGVLCFGPTRSQNVTFVRPDQWLGGWREIEHGEARAELLRRFLRAYGPVTMDDFGRWLGSKRRLREQLNALAGEVEEVEPKQFALAADRRALARARVSGGVRLVPGFDPFVLAPFSQRPVEAAFKDRVYRQAGWISATVVVGGQTVGVWRHERRGPRLEVRVEAFERIAKPTREAVEREAPSLARHLGGKLDLRIQ
jgi:hypothetical protein